MNLLPQSFYLNSDVVGIAKQLVGKLIYTNIGGFETYSRIIETEAYRGEDDKASHAFPNKRTERTKIMFEKGGVAYIYLIYGLHQMLNIVTGPEGLAHAVLIRALTPISGNEVMKSRRPKSTNEFQLCNGPGKLTKALGISKANLGAKFYDPKSEIRIYDDGFYPESGTILCGPRIGIDYAEECKDWPWRFWLKDSLYLSK